MIGFEVARMTDYVMAFLRLPREAAYARQKDLYRQYGTTLNGLMREHGAAPDDYLHYVHDIDLSDLAPDARLAAAIQQLPGRRFVFTNGCRDHAARILGRLGMAHLFDEVWDIRTIAFQPKPQMEAYQSVVAASGLVCGEAAMFDDIARNLAPARAMGRFTIVSPGPIGTPLATLPNVPAAGNENAHGSNQRSGVRRC